MSKRPLIFIISIVIALFLINQYFSWEESKKRTTLAAAIHKKEAEILQQSAEEFQQRVAPISALPLEKLYEDEACLKVASLAIAQGEQYLTLPWTDALPKTLFVKTNQATAQKVSLLTPSSQAQGAILYSTHPQPNLYTAIVPTTGTQDLQLVYFNKTNTEPHVSLGIVENGSFVGSIHSLSSPCIALYRDGKQYLPYGIYNPKKFNLELFTSMPWFASISIPQSPTTLLSYQSTDEQFFVLENDYLQLVFSNMGGAIAEINLPFASVDNQNSVVLPIGFDREMNTQHPLNNRFPLRPFLKAGCGNDLQSGVSGGYTPLLRRSIVAPNGQLAHRVPSYYYALNLVSQDPESSGLIYTMKRLEKNLIEFESLNAKRKITKTFFFPKDPLDAPYCFDLTIKVDGELDEGLRLTTGVPEVELISDSFTPALKYRTFYQKKGRVEQLSLPKKPTTEMISPEWISNSNGFLGVIVDQVNAKSPWLSADIVPGEILPTRLSLIDAKYRLYPPEKYPGYELGLGFQPTGKFSQYHIFAGPYAKSVFERIDATYYDVSSDTTPNFASAQSFHGWFSFISEPFAKFLFLLMEFFYFLTSSWGFSIILLTIALRIMLYPLNSWSIRSTLRMQEIGPAVQALQAKYKKDPKRAQMEVMHLYREKGINPLSGCFPLLIQLPFLIGMFDLLKSTFELRGTTFIPGWIDNLTAPDVLFTWSYPVFFIGTQFHLLPILLGAVMYIQQSFSSTAPKNTQQMTDQQKQQKFMGNIMVIVFTVMFYHFPSGLNIYWLSSMLLGILQQWYMMRKTRKGEPKIEIIK